MKEGRTVGLLVTCLVDLYRPGVGFAAIKLLESAGCRVVVPPAQSCCGQPAYNSGDDASSRRIARQVIESFESLEHVVVPSGSCAGMIVEHYPDLFKTDPDWHQRAVDLASRCHELTSFLTDVCEFRLNPVGFPNSVTYHDSCSALREMGIREQPRRLLRQVDDLTLNEMEDTDVCCGFGGTFCVKFPDISERMVNDKVALVRQSKADVLLGGDMGCLLNISGRLSRLQVPVRVYHIAEVLAGMADGPGIADTVSGRLETDGQ